MPRLDVCGQLRRRLFGAGIDAHGGGRDAREIAVRLGRFRRPFEAAQLDPAPERVALPELGRRQVQLARIQNGPVAIVAQLLVPLDDAVPELVGAGGGLVHVHDDARWRQILEQMRGALEEQRQVELDAARRDPGAHVAIHGLLGQIPRESHPIAAPELAHRVGVQRHLSRRQQVDAIELVQGALGLGIEPPDAVDIAVEEVDSIRRIGPHGKHVDQRAPHRELAVRHDLRDRGIARKGQLRPQALEVQSLADVHFERVRAHEAARCEPLQQRVDRDQPDDVARPRQLGEGREASRGDVGVCGERIVGQGLEVRKDPYRQRRRREKADLVTQPLGLARARRDDDEGGRRRRCRLRQCQRGSGAVQLAPLDDGVGWARENGLE